MTLIELQLMVEDANVEAIADGKNPCEESATTLIEKINHMEIEDAKKYRSPN